MLPRFVMRIVVGKGHGRKTVGYLPPCEAQREPVLTAVYTFMVIIMASLILVGVTSSLPDVCCLFPLLSISLLSLRYFCSPVFISLLFLLTKGPGVTLLVILKDTAFPVPSLLCFSEERGITDST